MSRKFEIRVDTNEATANVDKLANSLDKTGKSFDNASKSAEGFAKSTDNIQKVSKGMMGSIQAVSGAMTLLGKDSNATTMILGKFASVMMMTNGLKDFGEGVKSSALAQKLLALNTKLATTEMKGFRTALLTTGIGALAVAVGELVAHWDKVKEFFNGTKEVSDSATASTNEQVEAYKTLNDIIMTNIELNNLINKNKIGGGKSETQVLYEDTERAQKSLQLLQTEIEKKFGKSIKSLTNEWGYYNDQLLKGTKYEDKRKQYYESIGDALKVYNTLLAKVQELESKQKKTTEQTTKQIEEKTKVINGYTQAQYEADIKSAEIEDSYNAEINSILWIGDAWDVARKKMDDYFNAEVAGLKEEGEEPEDIPLIKVQDTLLKAIKKNRTEAAKLWEEMSSAEKTKAVTNSAVAVSDAFSDLLGNIASAFDENSEEYRAVMITQTILSTLGGIANALSSIWSPVNSEMTWIGQTVAAATTSAAILANGIATIAQMKNANENTTPSVPAISTSAVSGLSKPVTSSNLVKGYSEEDLESKVYVVESDITRFQNKKRNLKTNVRF